MKKHSKHGSNLKGIWTGSGLSKRQVKNSVQTSMRGGVGSNMTSGTECSSRNGTALHPVPSSAKLHGITRHATQHALMSVSMPRSVLLPLPAPRSQRPAGGARPLQLHLHRRNRRLVLLVHRHRCRHPLQGQILEL